MDHPVRALVYAAACAAMLSSGLAQAAPSGAIFTTLVDGSRVNANIFSAKCDGLGVYLDGGPGNNAPQGAAGLPDGDYYFQVTDPSGKTLLSTDPQKYRRFTVTAGIITSRVAPQATGDHDTGADIDHGAVTVELCPFLDTPNNGGEYKVWVTPIANFSGSVDVVDNGYNPDYFHGFIPASTKSDNFKVKQKQSACLTIMKFRDNGDGKYSVSEPYINWGIRVFDSAGLQIEGKLWTGTAPGALKVCALPPGNYTIYEDEIEPSGVNYYFVSANILDGKYIVPPQRSVVVKMAISDRTLIFGNYPK